MTRPSPFDPQEMARCWELYFAMMRREREVRTEDDWRKANADVQADYNTEHREGWSNGK